MNNPFNITFGLEPNNLISRDIELEPVFNSFSSDKPNSQVYILTGVRGCGKTVAMTAVVDYYKKLDWICVELNPEYDMLEQLASKLYDEGKMKKHFLKTEFDFSFHGIDFSLIGKEEITNVSSLIKKELEHLKSKQKRVLISIDEVVSNSNMKIFAHEFQSLLRSEYDICLIMTGLYNNISSLQNQKSLTFLYRAPKIYLDSLNMKSIVNSYKSIFEINESDAASIAKNTNGYAYAYQLIGNLLFESGKRKIDKEILDKFDEIIYERAYTIIYNELTDIEKNIINNSCKNSLNFFVMNSLGMSSSQLSSYKKKLELKGVLKEDRNEVVFKLPRFKEFVEFFLLMNC